VLLAGQPMSSQTCDVVLAPAAIRAPGLTRRESLSRHREGPRSLGRTLGPIKGFPVSDTPDLGPFQNVCWSKPLRSVG